MLNPSGVMPHISKPLPYLYALIGVLTNLYAFSKGW
ncbi:hypothetical protein QE357_001600 [Siphonobacter sp. BAB-5404]|nr:hypothetical protein [Siphonobacter sp. SORGH_AS_0500]